MIYMCLDTRGDEAPISPQTGDLLTPQARCCTSKDGEIEGDSLSQKNNFHPVHFFNVQQGNSGVHQRFITVDQEGWKLHFSLTVAEHI